MAQIKAKEVRRSWIALAYAPTVSKFLCFCQDIRLEMLSCVVR